MNEAKKRNRIIALGAAAAVLFVMLFSLCFLADHADHIAHCHESECPICRMADQCATVVKQIGCALAVVAAVVAIVKWISIFAYFVEWKIGKSTLITQKVRMND